MVKTSFCLVACLILMGGCVFVHRSGRVDDGPATCPPKTGAAIPVPVVRHVVLFKFKDDAPATEVRKIEQAFAALAEKVDLVCDFEWGTDISPENLQDGFTHCFIVTFKNAKDRDAYLPHPAHQEFVDNLLPHLDKALVVDFVTRR